MKYLKMKYLNKMKNFKMQTKKHIYLLLNV